MHVSDARAGLEAADEQRLLEQLVLVREFELACERWWNAGDHLIGEFHLSLGQEAMAVGTCAAIGERDFICPSIRGMGVYLCRNASMESIIASFYERQGGISEGRWPHWHSPVASAGILPQTGMLGSGLTTAVGVALAQKHLGTNSVVVGMLGDGATNTGYFHEAVNMAAVLQLPIVIVIENNQYAVSTPISYAARAARLSDRAQGYGIPGETIDGTNVLAVHEAVARAAEFARQGRGPTLLELKAYRWGGQTLKDPDRTRPQREKDEARRKCPVAFMQRRLADAGLVDDARYEEMVRSVRARIDSAAAAARAHPPLRAGSPEETLGSMPACFEARKEAQA